MNFFALQSAHAELYLGLFIFVMFGKSQDKMQYILAIDLPGGKRILMIKMRAQHTTFNKAIEQNNFISNASSLT